MDVKSPTEPLSVKVSQSAQGKVALDIDDAPFLVEEAPPKEALPPRVADSTELSLGQEAEPAQTRNKKRLLILGAALFLFLCGIGGALVWWFVLRTPPPSVVIEPEIIRVQSPPKDAEIRDFVIEFAPFWVEYIDEKGGRDGVLFLSCKFAVLTKSDLLVQEAKNKMPTLRDAVYYYLKNKPYQFLIDPANTQGIKADLASVLSGYLVGGKIDDVLFESYLAK